MFYFSIALVFWCSEDHPGRSEMVSQVTSPDGTITTVKELVIQNFSVEHSGTYKCVLDAAYSKVHIMESIAFGRTNTEVRK